MKQIFLALFIPVLVAGQLRASASRSQRDGQLDAGREAQETRSEQGGKLCANLSDDFSLLPHDLRSLCYQAEATDADGVRWQLAPDAVTTNRKMAAKGRDRLEARSAATDTTTSPAPVQKRMMLEAGIVGGNSIACPGHYVGVSGRVAGPTSVYGMVETYRCVEVPETSSRLGISVRLGRFDWFVRPAVLSGLEYNDDGDISHTVGASLTFGRRYGARFIVDRWEVPGGAPSYSCRLEATSRFERGGRAYSSQFPKTNAEPQDHARQWEPLRRPNASAGLHVEQLASQTAPGRPSQAAGRCLDRQRPRNAQGAHVAAQTATISRCPRYADRFRSHAGVRHRLLVVADESGMFANANHHMCL